MITIDGYVIDATITQNHTLPSEVTSHPVQEGSDVTDHVRNLPVSFDCECIVSNTPIGPVAALRGFSQSVGGLVGGEALPSDDVYVHLLGVREAREPIVVDTPLQRYSDMILTNLTVPIESKTGDAIKFTATFTQLRLVSVDRTIVKVAVPRAKKKKNIGHKATKKGTEAGDAKKANVKTLQAKQSWLGDLLTGGF